MKGGLSLTGNEGILWRETSVAANATALPLVSVIVVNYNHAILLPEAVESIMAQTYAPIECLIVDDASTDDSRSVIAALQERFPKVRALLLETNLGALRASLEGFAATSGAFVHFLDADDVVMPTFIEAHVGAHLSLRAGVGFTGCDAIISDNGMAVSCCINNISRYRSKPEWVPAPRRALPPHLAGPLSASDDIDMVLVSPSLPEWPWGMTSTIVYKRGALQFLAKTKGLERIRSSSDTFLCQGVNAIAGSAILDAPLAVYRFHGTNDHMRATPLDNVIGFDKAKMRGRQAATIEVLIEHVLNERHAFAERYWTDDGILGLLHRLCRLHPDHRSPERFIASHARALEEVVDRAVLRQWLKQKR